MFFIAYKRANRLILTVVDFNHLQLFLRYLKDDY